MSVGEIVAIVVASMTGIGLIATWVKNNHQSVKDNATLEANLKSEIKDVKDDIKHPEYGLSAINKKLAEQLLYCAKTSTSLKERVSSLEGKEHGRSKEG